MRLRGADLIAFYLSPDRLPVQRQWSRKHAHTQRRLCERFAAPVIDAVLCQDIKAGHMQKIVNAAPTPGEGGRVRGMISALVTAGMEGGYLASPRLAKVHWQAGDRPMPAPRVTVAGESALWVDSAEVPADAEVAGLAQALAGGAARGPRRADGQYSCLQRAAVGRAGRPHHLPDRPGRPGDRSGPQGGRGRRASLCRGAEEPQVPEDDLPSPHARRLPARRPPRAGPRRAGRRHQPAGADLPCGVPEVCLACELQRWARTSRAASATGPG
jgi:hypothetical protein